MPTTTNGITYPDGTGHTRLWEHLQTLAEDADDLAMSRAPLASPAFTGNPTAPTPSPGDNDTSIATTAFVAAAVSAVTALSARKTTDEYVTNSTTLQNDDHLFVTLTAGTWVVDYLLHTYQAGGAANGGFTTKWTYTGTIAWSAKHELYTPEDYVAPDDLFDDNDITAVMYIDLGGGSLAKFGGIVGRAVLQVTTGGTLRYQWAQAFASSASAALRTNSHMLATKIA